MSTMNKGMSGTVTAMMAAEIQSWLSTATSTTKGTMTARTSWGRYLVK